MHKIKIIQVVMKLLTIKNKSDVAEIYISGDIVDDADAGWIVDWRAGNSIGYEFPQKLKAQLDEVKDKPLEIHINSCGGSVFAGVAMANLIAQHKPKTTAIVDGIAASIATQIFFSADECKMPENAYLMLHCPLIEVVGNAAELRKAADVLDKIQDGLEGTYIPKMQAHLSLNNLREMMSVETWLTGKEASEKFKIQLLAPVKTLNAVGSLGKLKARGTKIPDALNFLDEPKPAKTLDEAANTQIQRIFSRMEGMMNQC